MHILPLDSYHRNTVGSMKLGVGCFKIALIFKTRFKEAISVLKQNRDL